jgi:hypothetical protein
VFLKESAGGAKALKWISDFVCSVLEARIALGGPTSAVDVLDCSKTNTPPRPMKVRPSVVHVHYSILARRR